MKPVIRILQSHPEGISEYNLITELEKNGITEFSKKKRDTDLSLFRTHFFLFHILYRLRDLLILKRQYILSIHCLKIILIPFYETSPSDQPARADPLWEYYMDLSNLESTDEKAVKKMLENFWERYLLQDKRREALNVLGLSESANFPKIKCTFRKLAHRHHPDHGGNEKQFRELNEAMEILVGWKNFNSL